MIWEIIKSAFKSFLRTFYDNESKSWLTIFIKVYNPKRPMLMSTLKDCEKDKGF